MRESYRENEGGESFSLSRIIIWAAVGTIAARYGADYYRLRELGKMTDTITSNTAALIDASREIDRIPCDDGQRKVVENARTIATDIIRYNTRVISEELNVRVLAALQNMSVFCGSYELTDPKTLAVTLQDNPAEVTLNYPSTKEVAEFNHTEICKVAGTLVHEAGHVITPDDQEPPKDVHDSEQNDWIYQIARLTRDKCLKMTNR